MRTVNLMTKMTTKVLIFDIIDMRAVTLTLYETSSTNIFAILIDLLKTSFTILLHRP